MRWHLVFWTILFVSIPALAGDRHPASPPPSQFEIGRHTFFDFGPPSDFYDVFLVHPTAADTSIERISFTPPGDACFQPAKVEIRSTSVKESVAMLLGTVNPCTIPEKELHRELKRCKKCMSFSGANVTMQVRCGDQVRTIRSDILDKDMFDKAANTPEHTSWTMRLLARLDQATGPGAMEQPMFAIPAETKAPAISASEISEEISSGKYDGLFEGAPDKPSDLYRASQKPMPASTVRLLSSSPLQPEVFVQPNYPPLARLAHVEGSVSFKVGVNPDGSTKDFVVNGGHPMLRGVVEQAVAGWKFPKGSTDQQVQATIEFKLNCPVEQPRR
jgi:hypothetical protein